MPLVHTTSLLDLLKARLEKLPVAAGSDEKLFERVAYFGAQQLGAALKATFAAEDRVCFIVPAGHSHAAMRDRNLVFVQREARFVLLIADRVMDQTTQAALVGGPRSIGILELTDRVVDDLFATAEATPDVAFVPGDGDVLVIEQAGQNLGRECFMQHVTAYAGSARAAIP